MKIEILEIGNQIGNKNFEELFKDGILKNNNKIIITKIIMIE